MLHDEAALVIEQENNRMASEATLLHAAAGALFSQEGGKHFMEIVRSLGEDD
jgi:hypothetical protein